MEQETAVITNYRTGALVDLTDKEKEFLKGILLTKFNINPSAVDALETVQMIQSILKKL